MEIWQIVVLAGCVAAFLVFSAALAWGIHQSG